ncbi:MAG TPA: M50 family metallopeptidase [Candidatus Binatia bacterium]|nr:M50 family metallopeptidase [Candidatus Binatia bacterium]
MSIFLLVLGLVLFILLVVVHEFGHFIVARRNGVGIEEFGIFFPPRIWSRKTKKGWTFSINLLPLGGFVRLKGEHDSDTGPHTFGAASLKIKTKILLAGVGMNVLAAFVIFTCMAWIGLPNILNNQFKIASDSRIISHTKIQNGVDVEEVLKGSPAARAKLATGSEITKVAGVAVTSPSQAASVIRAHAGQTVKLFTKKNNRQLSYSILLNKTTPNLGVEFESEITGLQLSRSTWSAPIVAGGLIVQFTTLTFQGLGHALAGVGGIIAGAFSGNHAARENAQTQASSQVTGPVGIFEILKNGTQYGYQFILFFIGYISLALAIMNVLPIPALDGGKLFVTLIARAMHKKLSETAEAIIYGTSFAVLILLVILITIVDVRRN